MITKPKQRPKRKPKPFARWNTCRFGHVTYDGVCISATAATGLAELLNRRAAWS